MDIWFDHIFYFSLWHVFKGQANHIRLCHGILLILWVTSASLFSPSLWETNSINLPVFSKSSDCRKFPDLLVDMTSPGDEGLQSTWCSKSFFVERSCQSGSSVRLLTSKCLRKRPMCQLQFSWRPSLSFFQHHSSFSRIYFLHELLFPLCG